MGWRSLAGRAVSVALLAAALGRVELCKYDKVQVSPLAVTAHFGMTKMHMIPPQAQLIATKFLSAMALPYEAAVENGIIQEKSSSSKKKSKKSKPMSLEKKSLAWLNKQKVNSRLKRFLDENTFAIAGGMITFFGMLLAPLFPYEAFQNVLLGLGCFWFGANGAHGPDTVFSNEFYGLVLVLAFALFFLAESSGKPKEAKNTKGKDKDAHGHSHAGGKACSGKDDDDEWDDGIGGVTAEERRQRGGDGGCCDGH